MRSKQKGFTLPELFIAIWILGGLAIGVTVIVVAIHFIAKFW